MSSLPLTGKLGLRSGKLGSPTDLAICISTLPDAVNNIGFYGDVTAGAEKLGTRVGGVTGPVAIRNGTAVNFEVPGSITAIAAATQDAVRLQGRAGGADSFISTITPAVLSASRTYTLPDKDGTVAMTSDIIPPTLTATQVGFGDGSNILAGSANFTYTVGTLATGFLNVANTLQSSATTNGAIVTAGGVGIAKALRVGGSAYISGNIECGGLYASNNAGTYLTTSFGTGLLYYTSSASRSVAAWAWGRKTGGTAEAAGFYGYADATSSAAPANNIGVVGKTAQSTQVTNTTIGVFGGGDASGTFAEYTALGVKTAVGVMGTRTTNRVANGFIQNIGVYGEASGATTNWAGYFRGSTVVTNNAAAPIAAPTGTLFQVLQADGSVARVLTSAFGSGVFSAYAGRLARGTAASPTAVQLDDEITHLSAWGYGATAYSGAYRAAISLRVAENWTDAAQGTRVSFYTTAPGTTTTTERVRTWGDGGVTIASSFTSSPGTNGLSVAGKITTAASSTGYAGLVLPHGVAPTSPVDGDMWTTTAGLYVQINGTTVGPLGTGGGGTPGGSNTQIQYNNGGAFGGTAGLSWNNTYKTLALTVVSSADVYYTGFSVNATVQPTSGAQIAVGMSSQVSGGNEYAEQVNAFYGVAVGNDAVTVRGGYFSADGNGTSDNAYGIYATATGATTNWDGYFDGRVRITGGTVTANLPALSLTQTWDNGAINFVGINLDITNTDSSATSYLAMLKLGGVARAFIGRDGDQYLTSFLTMGGYLENRGQAAPAVSGAGNGRIYFDSSANKYKASENGGAYVDLIGGGGADTTRMLTMAGANVGYTSAAVIEAFTSAGTPPTNMVVPRIMVVGFDSDAVRYASWEISSFYPNYAGQTLTLTIEWMTDATTGSCTWTAGFAAYGAGDDIANKVTASAKSATTSAPGTAKTITTTTITFTQAEADSVAAGDSTVLVIGRLLSGSPLSGKAKITKLTLSWS